MRNVDGPHDGPPNIKPTSVAAATTTSTTRTTKTHAKVASSVEKMILASVPGVNIDIVRRTLATYHGNPNRTIEYLLDEDGAEKEELELPALEKKVPIVEEEKPKHGHARERKELAKRKKKEAAKHRTKPTSGALVPLMRDVQI